MDDIVSKLQGVLGDENAMAQISELAKMLSGSSEPEQQSGSSNEGLSQLSSLLGGSPPPGQQSGGIDPATMLKLGSVISAATSNDDSINLLLALKPMVSEEKQAKIDRVISVFRLLAAYPALKESGLLGGEGLGLFK
ncbi:hypothetical protein [Ruminococcus sp. NK3A76]|uniref:hypothetical protein n=1 Tax=Ruminococcus sp. NK3A76 TaxID=877411 RepID=UPI00068E54EB|nr:hypothetical protein [Ruminococcus sp. NK3A76]